MRFIMKRRADGKYQAALILPSGDGSFASVAAGMSKAEATVKAARAARKAGIAKRKSATVEALGKVAKNKALRSALQSGGIQAAKMVATTLPGGAVAVKALELASKFKPARRLLSAMLGKKKKAKR